MHGGHVALECALGLEGGGVEDEHLAVLAAGDEVLGAHVQTVDVAELRRQSLHTRHLNNTIHIIPQNM